MQYASVDSAAPIAGIGDTRPRAINLVFDKVHFHVAKEISVASSH